MRRNTYLLTALLSAGLMACHNEPAFKVEGTVSGAATRCCIWNIPAWKV